MQLSRWQHMQVLLDPDEMEMLLNELPSFSIYNVSEIVETPEIAKTEFIAEYRKYIHRLRGGNPARSPLFAAALSASSEALYLMKVGEKFLAKPLLPVIQMRVHHFAYTEESFRSMALGKGTLSWGIQFSYPAIYQNSLELEVKD